MNDISLNDIENLVNCTCIRLESQIMDGSRHSVAHKNLKIFYRFLFNCLSI